MTEYFYNVSSNNCYDPHFFPSRNLRGPTAFISKLLTNILIALKIWQCIKNTLLFLEIFYLTHRNELLEENGKIED